eukprot:3068483-Rhodomonas_salina.1
MFCCGAGPESIQRVHAWSPKFGPTRSSEHDASTKFQVLEHSYDSIPSPPSPTETQASHATDQLSRTQSFDSNFGP